MTTALTHDPAAPLVSLFKADGGKLAAVAAKHLSAERVFRLAVGVFRRTPALQRCSPSSVLDACMIAARLGLEPDGGALAQAYLVPHGQECTLIVGYRGLIELARRSGQIRRVEARLVYRGDEFDYELGATPVLKHKPLVEDEGGEVTHAYAVAFFLDGTTQFEVMTARQLEHVRKSSRSGASGPWAQHAEEMCRKTVVRRLAKYLPLSPELAAGVALADQDEGTDARSVKATVRDALDMDSDAVYLKATVERPRPEAPPKRESVAEAKAKARSQKPPEAPKPDPSPAEVRRDGNRFRAAVAKLVGKGMAPDAAEDVATALFDGLDEESAHERVVAQSLRESLKVEVRDDSPTALLELIEGLS